MSALARELIVAKRNMTASPCPPTKTKTKKNDAVDSTQEEAAQKDRELAILLIVGIVVATCHPCLSENIAHRLNVSVDVLRGVAICLAVILAMAMKRLA